MIVCISERVFVATVCDDGVTYVLGVITEDQVTSFVKKLNGWAMIEYRVGRVEKEIISISDDVIHIRMYSLEWGDMDGSYDPDLLCEIELKQYEVNNVIGD
jgi:hypothetical protein